MARLDRTPQPQKPKPAPKPNGTSAQPPQRPTPLITDYASLWTALPAHRMGLVDGGNFGAGPCVCRL